MDVGVAVGSHRPAGTAVVFVGGTEPAVAGDEPDVAFGRGSFPVVLYLDTTADEGECE